MKKSDYNLRVIENFIDYYTSDDAERIRMKEVAADYISEDHVDGLEMEENENVLFTKDDMRETFVAGSTFGETDITIELGLYDESDGCPDAEPDFGEWMENKYGIVIE